LSSSRKLQRDADPKGGSRWAPIVVFGGILVIGIVSVSVVLAMHCNRDDAYLDPVKIRFDPNNVQERPVPERARGR